MTNEMKEFLDKVDELCWKYGYEIKPTHPIPNGECPTLTIVGGDESIKLVYIDGDGMSFE
jgi:hypothetical protein